MKKIVLKNIFSTNMIVNDDLMYHILFLVILYECSLTSKFIATGPWYRKHEEVISCFLRHIPGLCSAPPFPFQILHRRGVAHIIEVIVQLQQDLFELRLKRGLNMSAIKLLLLVCIVQYAWVSHTGERERASYPLLIIFFHYRQLAIRPKGA